MSVDGKARETVSSKADDASCNSSGSESTQEEFDFIESEWENGVEIGLKIVWPESGRPLHLSTKMEEDCIAPLFDGTQWAGTRVWKAAVRGLEYILEHHGGDGGNLLELGCGLGVPGMLWKLLKPSSNVILTDMPDLLPQLDANVQKNFADTNTTADGQIQALALDWSTGGITELYQKEYADKDVPMDICINCDCIYEPLYGRDAWEALADVLACLAQKSPSTLLVTSVERRNGDGLEQFWDRLKGTGTIGEVKRVLRDDEDKHHVIEIYITKGIET